jgi:GntR family transcriptional regulator, carbon starvation induced regulator
MSPSAHFEALPDTDSADTLAERAAALLHRAVLTGELKPGAKLRIRDLQEMYGIGATPLREGLSRLVAAGLIQAVGQRGFRVVNTSEGDLRDILRVRTLIEVEALRLAITHGDDAWEAGIVAALHRLSRAAAAINGGIEGVGAFDAVHKGFHSALIAACGSPRMLELQSMLYDQTYRYRQVMFGAETRRKIAIGEHEELANRTIERRTDLACALLAEHLTHTLKATYPHTT